MNNEWDEYAESWDVDASVQEYARRAFKELTTNIDINGLSVFDFGCGTGTLSQLLSSRVRELVALDGSSEMTKYLLKKNLGNVTVISNVLSQDLIDAQLQLSKKFDLIVASSVCGFLDNYEATLALLKSLLKSGGVFVQWDWLSNDESSETGLSENRVSCALNANGFTDIQIKVPFEMTSSKGTRPVLMAIAKIA